MTGTVYSETVAIFMRRMHLRKHLIRHIYLLIEIESIFLKNSVYHKMSIKLD